ncbi:MAG: hypothetical protein A2W22_06810 [Candidatus Levybacteria bacterium RBG_16_35_11]|nr:MAG: hypothetical protein A2W22_06810 [Candidatus Levybacteria bacterium RBG_16_35_11]
MKKALEYIITSIVDNPEGVKITETEENNVITFSIEVAKEDMGKIIGKNGKIIKAIRNVMKIPAMKAEKRIFVNLVENSEE